MFENKKEGKLSNSDLLKLVRRRKEKLDKKLYIDGKESEDQQAHLNPTSADESEG